MNVLSQKMFTCSTTEIFVAFNCYYECVGSQRNHSINFSIKSVACLICCRKKVVSSLDSDPKKKQPFFCTVCTDAQ